LRPVSTAHAILVAVPLAGLLIGIGLWLGLSTRAPARVSPPPGQPIPQPRAPGPLAPPPTGVSPPGAPPPVRGGPSATPAPAGRPAELRFPLLEPAAPRDDVERLAVDEVTSALAAHKAALRSSCWDALPPAPTDPPSSRWIWQYTFDAKGKQLARGVVEQRGAARLAVTRCVQLALPPLTLPHAPGRPVRVSVAFDLP
jgi:hypothetical protein